jgi:hypothetical protein
MFLSHDCGLTFLWKLYLYVQKSFCKDTENFNKRVVVLNTSITCVESLHLYSKEQAGENSLQRYGQ